MKENNYLKYSNETIDKKLFLFYFKDISLINIE